MERISSVSSEAVMLSWMAFWKADASILMALSIWLLSLPMFCWMAVLSWDCIWSWKVTMPFWIAASSWLFSTSVIWSE